MQKIGEKWVVRIPPAVTATDEGSTTQELSIAPWGRYRDFPGSIVLRSIIKVSGHFT